jgi:hypothetical protein
MRKITFSNYFVKNFFFPICILCSFLSCEKSNEIVDPCSFLEPRQIEYNWKIVKPDNHFVKEILGQIGDELIYIANVDNNNNLVLYNVKDGTIRSSKIAYINSLYFLAESNFYFYEDFSFFQLDLKTLQKKKIFEFTKTFHFIKADYVNNRILLTEAHDYGSINLRVMEYHEAVGTLDTIYKTGTLIPSGKATINLWEQNGKLYLTLSKILKSTIHIDKIDLESGLVDRDTIKDIVFDVLYTRNFKNGIMYKNLNNGLLFYQFDTKKKLYLPNDHLFIFLGENAVRIDKTTYNLEDFTEIKNIPTNALQYVNNKWLFFKEVNFVDSYFLYDPSVGCLNTTLQEITFISHDYYKNGHNAIFLGLPSYPKDRSFFYSFKL